VAPSASTPSPAAQALLSPAPAQDMTRPAALALLVLAVAAGCNAPGAGGPSTPVTPAAVPEAQVEYPPGLSPDGIDRPERVAQAHADAIGNRSYELTLSEVRYTARTVRVERTAVRRVGPARYNGSVVRQLRRRSGVIERRTLVYADGEHRYSRTVNDGAASYQLAPVERYGDEGVYEETAERLLARYLAVDNATVSRTRRGNETLFRLAGRGSERVEGEGYRVVALVTPGGLVRELRVNYEPTDGPVLALEVRWRYAGLGRTTASVPEWYPEARATTG